MDTGKDKVKKICEVLRKETIEPAIEEAREILEDAHQNGESIVRAAEAKAEKILADAETEIQKRQNVFRAALNQGARQAVEWLKQEIEDQLFNRHLAEMVTKSMVSPQVLADMVSAIVKAVADEGLNTDLSALIPSTIQPRQVNELIGKDILERLKEKSVAVGSQKGGVEVKLHDGNVTIDLSDNALLELLIRYVRKDFHQFFFADKKENG